MNSISWTEVSKLQYFAEKFEQAEIFAFAWSQIYPTVKIHKTFSTAAEVFPSTLYREIYFSKNLIKTLDCVALETWSGEIGAGSVAVTTRS